MRARFKDQTPDIKLVARHTESFPVFAQFRRWLEANSIGLPPQPPLAKAFGYALRHWQALVRYTENAFAMAEPSETSPR
jgi:transposase